MSRIKMTVDDAESQQLVSEGGPPLRDLCRKEAELFDTYLRTAGAEVDAVWADGLASWEREAIAGYIYQKLRGRVDSAEKPSGLPG
jgi:hypothetical protein